MSTKPATAPRDAGFTLAELLVALAVLAVVVGFASGGLGFAIRASEATRMLEGEAELAALREALRGCAAAAMPVARLDGNGQIALAFAGEHERLDLVCPLAAGRDGKSSVRRLVLRLDRRPGGRASLVVDEEPFLARGSARAPRTHVVAEGVRSLAMRYFGSANVGEKAAWHAGWEDPQHLPRLVAIAVGFADDDRRRWPELVARVRSAE